MLRLSDVLDQLRANDEGGRGVTRQIDTIECLALNSLHNLSIRCGDTITTALGKEERSGEGVSILSDSTGKNCIIFQMEDVCCGGGGNNASNRN